MLVEVHYISIAFEGSGLRYYTHEKSPCVTLILKAHVQSSLVILLLHEIWHDAIHGPPGLYDAIFQCPPVTLINAYLVG